ncbi:MAG: MOSC domain-containing protein [Acidobacteriota bacterium]|nr:MOSC domain-containing protein [Acidobacteriota bacterium]
MTSSPLSSSTNIRTAQQIVGSVESLWRYPVKSMRGEKLQEAFAGFAGVYGDRLYAFRSAASPPGFPYLTAREQEEMLLYRPAYRYPERMARPSNLAEAEALGSGLTPVYADSADRVLDVQTPAGETLEIDDPRLIGLLRTRISPLHELTLLRSDRAMTDCRPISLISLQTIQQLGQESGFELDQRRFRANVFIKLSSGTAFGENEFVGQRLGIGAKAIIMVLQRDTRCKMITLDPDTGKANPDIMRRLARDHESKAGVYGAVLVEGIVRPGDQIALLN